MNKKAKPIRTFIDFLGVVDNGEQGIQARITGYGGVPDMHALTSRVISEFHKNDKGDIVSFETMNSIYVRRMVGRATP